jgi:hypothetical protein
MTTETLALPSIEEVLKPLAEMKSFIESQTHNDWSLFNHAKKSFLDTFKTIANSPEKQKVWKEFTDVADSARNIRKLQEEEGEFAAEMIAKALDALEQDLSMASSYSYFHPLFDKVASFKSLKHDLIACISQIKFLSSIADKIQALRDELSKTGMRLSIKGRLFDRLSSLGDKVFPVKKDASIHAKELFKQGVSQFVSFSQKHDDGAEILFQIRIIQSFLKELNLKKGEYDHIRNLLEPVWKNACVLKDKKEAAIQEQSLKSQELKQGFEQSFEEMKQHIADMQDDKAMNIYDALTLKLKDRQIMKNDFKNLKAQLEDISKPMFDRLKAQRDVENQAIKAKAQELSDKKQQLLIKMQGDASAEDKKMTLNEAISLNLSDDEVYRFKYTYFSALNAQLKDQYELQDLYFELKNLQEMIRGSLAISGLDFAKSMNLQDINEDVKELLNDVINKLD